SNNSGETTLAGSTGPKQTLTAFSAAFSAALPGDKLLLCKGGAWDNWAVNGGPRNASVSAYAANPVVVDSFSPTQFSSTAQPRLNTVASRGSITVTAITKATSGVVTAVNTLANGDTVVFGAVTGMPEINNMQGSVSSVSG